MIPGSGVFIESVLANGNDSDVITVFLREGEVYDFWLGGKPSEGNGFILDPLMALTGGPGAPIAISDDDSAEGLNATLTFTPPAGGSGLYQLTVQDLAHVGGGYDLVIADRSLEPDITDHIFAVSRPDALGTSTVLAEGDVLVSDIGASSLQDVDTVAVLLKAGVTYSFDMRGASTDDGTLAGESLHLLSADGVELTGQAANDADAFFNFKPTQDGVFFLKAAGFDRATGSYTLQFHAATPAADVAGSVATIANLPLGDAVIGQLGGAGEDGSDWYAIHLVAGQQYEFDLAGLPDPGLTLRDSAGSVVAQGADVGMGVDDRILFTADHSGLFYLDAHDEAAGTGSFELSAHRLGATPAPLYALTVDSADASYVGSEQADAITGGGGSDFIEGEGGNDTLAGGAGFDQLLGVLGNDSLDGGDSNDFVSGGLGADTLRGGTGDDTLDGGGGNDVMAGGLGNDTFFVDSPADVVGEGVNQGIDTVQTALGYTLGANVEDLSLLGDLNVNGTGNALANVMFGNLGVNVLNGLAGNDTLNGGQGNDVLVGGAGKDLLTGSGGLDRMVFNSLSDSGPSFAQRDAINTFAHGDHIDLSALDANSKLAGNQAFTFVTNFTHVAGQLQFDQVATNSWFVSADVNGDGVADFSLNVFSAPGFGTLHGFDFIL